MAHYSDAELELMLGDLESDLVERKESFKGSAPTTVREAVCAFANDLPDHRRSDVVILGARDDGSSAGMVVTDDLLRQLADIKTDGNIVPPPTMSVEKRWLRATQFAVITVAPSDSPPVRFKGHICVRTGPRRGQATAQDERVLSEKRRHRDKPFDIHPAPSACLADLSRPRFEDEYLPTAFARDVLEANERSYQQRLAATKMVVSADDPTPTILGLLVLGTNTRDFLPGAYIQFLRFAGRALSDPIIDEQVCDGSVAEVLRRIRDKLESHVRTHIDITSNTTETRIPTYPLAALDQYIRNAVMHRTYESTNAPIRVTWLDDRIEIISPGGPFGTVTEKNFGKPGVSDYRNPNLAEALRVLGFVQRFGVGIATAERELTANGNPPPQYVVTPSNVAIIVRVAG